jgi:hypothetical protein
MYYDGANWQWGDEMDENLVTKVIADLDRIAKKIEEIQAGLRVEKQKDAIPDVDPVWCEHIKWAYWISGYAWEFVWREDHATKLSDLESREGCGYKSTCEFKFCPICAAPRPSTKAQEVEKKDPRKLAEIMESKVGKPGYCWSFPELAGYAIDAVTQCYEEWNNLWTEAIKANKPASYSGKFPEYLKEKML